MIQIFKEIAEKVNGKLQIDDQVVSTGLGSRSPHRVYSIIVKYKGISIVVLNEVGTTAVGRAKCIFPKHIKYQEFKINTRSHFMALFYGKDSRFKIEANTLSLQVFLKGEIKRSGIMPIVKQTKFEPYIFSSNENAAFSVITEYHLLYPEWPVGISPLINFYKALIDRFVSDYN